jgi:hypothetical protein
VPREPAHPGVESEPTGGASSDRWLASAVGGCSLERFSAFLERGFHGPAWCVPLHQWLRLQRDRCRQDIFGAMGPCPILNVDPPDCHPVCAATGPVPRARDDLEVSRGASLPRHREAGALGRVRPHRLGSGPLLALHARAAHRVARARGRRCVPRGLTINLAHHGEVLAVLMAKPCRLAGPVAAVAYEAEVPLRQPAPQRRQPQPGHGRWRRLPRAGHAIRRRRSGHSHQAGEGPRAGRHRQLPAPRHDAPLRPPARGGRAAGRAYASAMPSLPTPLGAGMFGDRLGTRQKHRPRRHHMVQQARDPGTRECPGRPSALGKHPRISRSLPLRGKPNGAKPVSDGASPRRQHRREDQDQQPGSRRGGTRGPKHHQEWPHTRRSVPSGGPSMGGAAAELPGREAAISP